MATGEFICGLFFLACGAALLFYNKPLVERSREFQPRNLRAEEGGGDIFDRFLCGPCEVRRDEVRSDEVRRAEVRHYFKVLFPPLVPHSYPPHENIEMLLIRHSCDAPMR